ncbi:thermonuclease family protein [Azospirillum sp. SYSU D00513]|uniref:thermonuclease family protein n=1 Tax=Azospirillum sp. SYSU D00513 TaxID=2812561 RepID=UPI001A96C589
MSGGRRAALLALALLAGTIAEAGPAVLPGPIPAEVLEVIDGDTIAVRALIWLGQVVETNVRVDGIDTPESRARCDRERKLAAEAKDLTRRLVGTGPVALMDVQPDKFGNRVRARIVTPDGLELSQSLIKAGLARPYKGEKRQPWCEAVGAG